MVGDDGGHHVYPCMLPIFSSFPKAGRAHISIIPGLSFSSLLGLRVKSTEAGDRVEIKIWGDQLISLTLKIWTSKDTKLKKVFGT